METFSVLLAICEGNSPVIGEFPAQRPVARGFDVFFDLRLNKRLSKQSWAGDLRRHRTHYEVIIMQKFRSTATINNFSQTCANSTILQLKVMNNKLIEVIEPRD